MTAKSKRTLIERAWAYDKLYGPPPMAIARMAWLAGYRAAQRDARKKP